MKAPAFWYQSQGVLSILLQPLGWLYDKGGRLLSHFKKPQCFQIPIISIGNIVSGGSGKTPTAIALAHLLNTRGYKVHFVTRGYGGKEKGPIKVDTLDHMAKDVGDEPLLLAEHAPTWVAKKRSEGVQKAIENGAQLIILDDGHQTTSLHKDVSLVVIDLLQGFGNGNVIPAGPLRENLSQGLQRADGFILIGGGEVPYNLVSNLQSPPAFAGAGVRALHHPVRGKVSNELFHSSFDFGATHLRSGRTEEGSFPSTVRPERRLQRSRSRRIERRALNSHLSSLGALVEGVAIQELQKLDCDVAHAPRNDELVKPLFQAQLIAHPLKVSSKRVIAFCGLGFPQKFYTSLENEGFELLATQSFPDHYQYTMEDLLKLQKLAQKHDCALITTRKDMIKIPPPWQKILYVLDITIKFEDPEEICNFILQKIHH